MKYTFERKEAVLKKMMPPHNRFIIQLAKEEGISEVTLYNWRNEARTKKGSKKGVKSAFDSFPL